MSAHGSQPPNSSVNSEDAANQLDKLNLPEVDNIKELHSTEDAFAEQLESYREGSSQNPFFVEMIIAGAYAGITYCGEVVSAYHFLKKPLDPDRLINDTKYKARVERYLQLVKKFEGEKRLKEGKSKYSEIVKNTDTAIGQVNTIHREQIKIKTSATNQYQTTLKSVYGVDDAQIKTTLSRATQRIKENPTLSMHDAIKIETRGVIREKLLTDAYNKAGLNIFKRAKAGKEANKRFEALNLEEKDKAFTAQTSTAKLYEDGRCVALRQDGKRQIAQTLSIELKPAAQQPPPPPPPQEPLGPPPPPPPPPPSRLPTTKPLGLPKQPPQWFSSFKHVFSKIPTVTNISGVIFRSVISKGADFLAKKGVGLAIRTALGQIFASAIPVLGNIGMALYQFRHEIFGVGKQAVMIAIAIGIGLFVFIFMSPNDQFQTYTPDNPLKIPLNQNQQTQANWQNFEREYLLAENQPKPTNIVEFSWKSFEENILSNLSWKSFEKEYLTSR